MCAPIEKREGTLLVAVEDRGEWRPAVKVSDTLEKIPNPGRKSVWRVYDDRGRATADLLSLDDEAPTSTEPLELHHPTVPGVSRVLGEGRVPEIEPLLVDAVVEGKRVGDDPTVDQMREWRHADLARPAPSPILGSVAYVAGQPRRFTFQVLDQLAVIDRPIARVHERAPIFGLRQHFGGKTEQDAQARREIDRVGLEIPVIKTVVDRFHRERVALFGRRDRGGIALPVGGSGFGAGFCAGLALSSSPGSSMRRGSTSATASFISRTPVPSRFATCGTPFAPNRSARTPTRITISQIPRPKGIGADATSSRLHTGECVHSDEAFAAGANAANVREPPCASSIEALLRSSTST